MISGNHFGENSVAGVGIEHGSANEIIENKFVRNPKGVWLW